MYDDGNRHATTRTCVGFTLDGSENQRVPTVDRQKNQSTAKLFSRMDEGCVRSLRFVVYLLDPVDWDFPVPFGTPFFNVDMRCATLARRCSRISRLRGGTVGRQEIQTTVRDANHWKANHQNMLLVWSRVVGSRIVGSRAVGSWIVCRPLASRSLASRFSASRMSASRLPASLKIWNA